MWLEGLAFFRQSLLLAIKMVGWAIPVFVLLGMAMHKVWLELIVPTTDPAFAGKVIGNVTVFPSVLYLAVLVISLLVVAVVGSFLPSLAFRILCGQGVSIFALTFRALGNVGRIVKLILLIFVPWLAGFVVMAEILGLLVYPLFLGLGIVLPFFAWLAFAFCVEGEDGSIDVLGRARRYLLHNVKWFLVLAVVLVFLPMIALIPIIYIGAGFAALGPIEPSVWYYGALVPLAAMVCCIPSAGAVLLVHEGNRDKSGNSLPQE